MNTPDKHASEKHDWVLRARALLEADARATDAGTRARLAHARARALADAERASPRHGWRLLAAAAVLAGVAVIAAQLAPPATAPGPIAPEVRAVAAPPLAPAQRAVATADYALVAELEDAELLEELEFYAWLAESAAEAGGEHDG